MFFYPEAIFFSLESVCWGEVLSFQIDEPQKKSGAPSIVGRVFGRPRRLPPYCVGESTCRGVFTVAGGDDRLHRHDFGCNSAGSAEDI